MISQLHRQKKNEDLEKSFEDPFKEIGHLLIGFYNQIALGSFSC